MMWKKLLLSAAILGAMCGPAMAADLTVQGSVPVFCNVIGSNSYNFGQNLSQGRTWVGNFTYSCNGPNGFTRTISSANNGRLVNAVGGYLGPTYQVDHDGSNGLTLPLTALTSIGVQTSVPPNDVFLTGATGSDGDLWITLPAAPTTPYYAGNYSDTISITITPTP